MSIREEVVKAKRELRQNIMSSTQRFVDEFEAQTGISISYIEISLSDATEIGGLKKEVISNVAITLDL